MIILDPNILLHPYFSAFNAFTLSNLPNFKLKLSKFLALGLSSFVAFELYCFKGLMLLSFQDFKFSSAMNFNFL